MLIDMSINNQSYIEDCEICCNPIQLNILIQGGEITNFSVESIEQ